MVAKRNRINNTFFVITLAIYSGFIFLVAFAPELMIKPVASGMTTSIGIALGLLVLISASVMIMIYTIICNRAIDPMLEELLKEVE